MNMGYERRENHQGGSFHKATWASCHQIKRGDLVVSIESSDHRPFPRFRFRLGRPYEYEGNERLGAIQPRIDGHRTGRVTMDTSVDDAVELLKEAKEWILTQAGSSASQYNDFIVDRDRGFVPEHRRTGKTQRERDKRRRG